MKSGPSSPPCLPCPPQPVESCCFLRMLLRLYVERVFSSSSLEQAHLRRSTSNLANSFLSIKKDLRQCVSNAAQPPNLRHCASTAPVPVCDYCTCTVLYLRQCEC